MSGELTGTTGLRASHADRDRVVDVLTGAAGDGRLTAEELDERVEAALSARTLGELAALTADLPVVAGATPVELRIEIVGQLGFGKVLIRRTRRRVRKSPTP